MDLKLPVDVVAVLHQIQSNGFEAYIVGGAVRDLFLSKDVPTDWDFTTNATPTQIQSLFPESFYENEFGTVGIDRQHVRDQFQLNTLSETQADNTAYNQVINVKTATKIHESLKSVRADSHSELASPQNNQIETKTIFEITTFRSEGMYTDFRRPDQVSWGQTLEEDLRRRDFTINALAIFIDFQQFNFDKTLESLNINAKDIQIIDPFGGLTDLHNHHIRTVGKPVDRFQEDALRMLRAIRFAVQLHFSLDKDALKAIKQHAALLQHVSWERIRDEFLKMLASAHPAKAIEHLDETGMLKFILPELLLAKSVVQGGHHTTDVWTHSIEALRECPSKDPIVRLATLLHDIAKPQTFRQSKEGITFYNHEVIGARVAKKIAERLKLSKQDTQRIFLLVRHHMFYYQPTITDAAIRRFMRKIGLENINDVLDVRIGDRLGSGAKETSWRLEEMKGRMLSQLHQPFSITDLKINGNELMTELHLKPGPILGKLLHHLFELVLEEPELNTKEKLIEEAKKFIS
ncbi:MAG: HDIG domain-containing metalloprotein [Patescibacteria group bacterium]